MNNDLVFRGIQDAIVPQSVHHPQAGHHYVAGVDWGRDHDYTVIVILDATTRQIVAMDRFSGIGWGLQRERLKALVDHWKPTVVWAEANSIGMVNIEALLQEGLPMRPYMTTSRSKSPLIESLALAIERCDIGLLDDPILLAELESYYVEPLPMGRHRYRSLSGSSDDVVIAIALAWYAVENNGIRLTFA